MGHRLDACTLHARTHARTQLHACIDGHKRGAHHWRLSGSPIETKQLLPHAFSTLLEEVVLREHKAARRASSADRLQDAAHEVPRW